LATHLPDPLARLQAALADRYRLDRELGQGGMATVYLVHDLKHDRDVALKVLRPEFAAIIGADRFLTEIRTTAALQHPHILPLFDSGAVDEGSGGADEGSGGAGRRRYLYYVMPYVEGESLRDRLAREHQLPLAEALRIAADVGSALDYAHRRGVIHRDIKPENILLTEGGAMLADFGIAVAVTAAGGTRLTETGMSVGTPHYMSPEQAAADRTLDGRSDIYSLGCVVYEMLAAEPPYTGPSAQAILAKRFVEPVPHLSALRDVPPAVEQAVTRALARAPADRFTTAADFLEALTGGAPALPQRARHPAKAIIAGVLAAAATWLVVAGYRASRSHPASGVVTAVAVLPFQDLASGPDSSYLGDGLTEGLIADLAEVGSLKVISRSSGAVAQGTARSLAELASELGVQAVVQGSIRRLGDTVRVSVRFLHAPDSALLLAKDYQSRLGELPDLQREITVAITGSIGAKLEGSERSRLDVRRVVNQRAFEAYLRGRFHLEREELEQARTLFEQASRIAPDWAPPYVGLANYYTALPFYSDTAPAEVLPKAREALNHALELDESLAEAHAANGYIRAYYEWDWRAAEREFRRALELRPNYADAYFSYSRFLASRRRLDEAIAQLGRAVELDPLSLGLQTNRALLDYFAGRYGDADSRLREVLKRDSTDGLAKWGLALVAEQQGRLDDAIAILEGLGGGSLNRKSSLGHAYAVAGRVARARSVLTALHTAESRSYVPSYWFALVHSGLGERDQALHYLERAYQERSTVLAYVLIDPRLAPLRDDARFLALTRRLGGE
jgi:eukaryotic-like serine/threonine-protein kinase